MTEDGFLLSPPQEGSPTPGSPAPRVEDENLAPESEVGVGAGDPSRMPLVSFLLAQGPKERVRASDSRAGVGGLAALGAPRTPFAPPSTDSSGAWLLPSQGFQENLSWSGEATRFHL